MTGLFSDRYKLALLLASIFVLGMGVSLYFIYSLPHALRLGTYDQALSNLYTVLAATFIIGGVALVIALQYKKEVLVFRDRALESNTAQQDSDQSGKTTISLDKISALVNEGLPEKELLQQSLVVVAKELEAGQGALYKSIEEDGKRRVELQSAYALAIGESTEVKFEYGEGLIGQAAASGNTLYVDDIPQGYVKIVSGLGSASPKYLLIVPIKQQDKVLGVIELASFAKVTEDQRRFAEEAAQLVANKISAKS